MQYKLTSVGELKPYNEKPVPIYKYGIFVYYETDDISEIVGTTPILYNNINSLMTNFPYGDLKEWMDKGITVVIRPVEVVEEE